MATLEETWFEVERRNIMFKPTTTLPDSSSLGFDEDPNTVINNNTEGETLLYNCPIATMFTQSDGTLWFKKESPNLWINFNGGSAQQNEIVGYQREFTFSNLSNGLLNVNHNLNLKNDIGDVTVISNNNSKIQPDDIIYIDSNSLIVDFRMLDDLPGTWKVYVEGVS
jgi:hypothetical protein